MKQSPGEGKLMIVPNPGNYYMINIDKHWLVSILIHPLFYLQQEASADVPTQQ